LIFRHVDLDIENSLEPDRFQILRQVGNGKFLMPSNAVPEEEDEVEKLDWHIRNSWVQSGKHHPTRQIQGFYIY